MAVTKYYTVNGKIRGEATEGVYRPYGTDALGSVVATYDSSGLLENTYRNAPYGTQVAKTGMADDPKFKWIGGSGYRFEFRSGAEQYVRSRSYGAVACQWSSPDALWPNEEAYVYAHCQPTLLADPSGQAPTRTRHSCICWGRFPHAVAGLALSDPRYPCAMSACRKYCWELDFLDKFLSDTCGHMNIALCAAVNNRYDPCQPSNVYCPACHSPYGATGSAFYTAYLGCCVECAIRLCCWYIEPNKTIAWMQLQVDFGRCHIK